MGREERGFQAENGCTAWADLLPNVGFTLGLVTLSLIRYLHACLH